MAVEHITEDTDRLSEAYFKSLKFMERPLKYRPAGAPAGKWPHTPWWICVFYDPYERINFWSHLLPGLGLIILGLLARVNIVAGSSPLFIFCMCGAATHVLSATTHVYPDDHYLEKLDHIGIVALIAGTPLTALMAKSPHGPYHVLIGVSIALLFAAFLRPVLRTVMFIALGAINFYYYNFLVNTNLLIQVTLYVSGGYFFVRNGGHTRFWGFQDHHVLHYVVTVACALHVFYIWDAIHHQKP